MRKLLLIFTLPMLLLSCGKEYQTLVGKGELESETRMVEEFSNVKSTIAANIQIFESDEYKVIVTLQKNLIPYLETTVKNGVLSISFDDYSVSTNKPISIDIYTPSLNEFTLTGSGDVTSELPLSNINLTSSGNFNCVGEVDNLNITLSGSGNFHLFDMPAVNADIALTGSGNIYVTVIENLKVTITGSGNVYYKGNPSINTSILGSGNVINSN